MVRLIRILVAFSVAFAGFRFFPEARHHLQFGMGIKFAAIIAAVLVGSLFMKAGQQSSN